MQEWEAGKPHEVEVKVKGNAMTQKYYTERLLPIYCQAIKDQAELVPGEWYLLEDRDLSHGMRKEGLARQYKDARGVKNYVQPAQSPDLNLIEAIWNIIKQRLRCRMFDSEGEIKEAIQEEWDKITMKKIRDRIKDLPGRYAQLRRTGGKAIKTVKW